MGSSFPSPGSSLAVLPVILSPLGAPPLGAPPFGAPTLGAPPFATPPSPPFLREEGELEDELSEEQEALLPSASQAAAAAVQGITAEGGNGAAGAKSLPFCLAIAAVLFLVVILGLLTFAARYYVRIHLRRARLARNDAAASTANVGGPQASGGGLDAERIATFPVWRYCISPPVAGDIPDKSDLSDKKPILENGEKEIIAAGTATTREIAITTDAANLIQKSDSQEMEFLKRGRLLLTSTECTVCLSDFNEGELVRSVLPCEHRFHVACIDHWLATKTTCPVCRTDLKSLAPHAGEDDSDLAEKVAGGDDAV
ncbi:unnamed protein product [Closterium sp. Yama58-4]|nr:unnamed protein product [Closterium sp. Yama58-4]